MIEPLRYCHEAALPMVLRRPVFCGGCLKKKTMKKDPNVAIKHCDTCYELTKKFLCATCDEEEHRLGPKKKHLRRLVVIGAGVRKKTLSRGDGVFFPLPMDRVNIKLQCRVYHQGKMIKKLQQTKMNYMVGLSGQCVHVQVLGAKNITAADMNGKSDPYMVALFQGKKLGITRVKSGTVNPRWKSETFIVPMADNLPDSRSMSRSAKGLFKLEVYDYDFIGANDFLGHFEIHKDKLLRLAQASKAQPLLFPLTTKEFHGIVGLQMGLSQNHVALKVTRAENLDKFNPFADGKPFVKVYFGDEYLGATSWEYDRGQVSWDGPRSRSEFRLKVNTVLRRERTLVKRRVRIEEIIREKAEKAEQKKAERRLKRKLMSSKKLTHEEERLLETMKMESKKRSQKRLDDDEEQNANEENRDIENEPIDLTTELGDHENADIIFRLEVFEYNFVRAPSFLGELKVPVGDIRKMCPQLPVHLQEERDPPTMLDRQLEQQRHLLNRGGCCKGPAVDLSDDPDPEEDDEWWVQQFGESSERSLVEEEDDPVLQKLAGSAAAMASDQRQSIDEDERSVGSLGEASLGSLDGGGAVGEEKTGTPAPKRGEERGGGSPDSVQEMLQASQSAERALLTEENLADLTRKLRSPGPPADRKAFVEGGVNGASPSNENFRGEDEAGTDVEGDDSDGQGTAPQAASPLMQAQMPEQTEARTESKTDAAATMSRWRVMPPTGPPPMCVFSVGAVAGSLEDMALSVDAAAAAAPHGEADPKEVYRSLAAHPDLLSLGGEVYQGTDLEYNPHAGVSINPEAGVEVEETDFDDEGEDPRALLLGGDSSSASDQRQQGYEEAANNPGLPSEQQMIEGMVDVTDEELQRMEQQQREEREEREERAETSSQQSRATGVSGSTLRTRDSATDDPKLGSRKRDRKSRRAKPPSLGADDESKEEGVGKYQLLSADGPSPSKDSQTATAEESVEVDPDALVFGSVRHYQVHRDGEKQVEGAKKEDGGGEELGHVILRLLPSNRGNVIAGLDEGVRHMSLGETANIKVRFDHAYSSFAMTEYIPARANMVFTVKLKAINGFGLAGLPLRMVKRLYRFTTFACRKTSDFLRFVYRDAKKKKRMRRLCSFLYGLVKREKLEELLEDDDEVQEWIEEEAEESDDEEEARPLTIKADASMRKHLTPSVHAGAKYFWNYKPQVRAKKSKKSKKKEEEEEDSDASSRSADSDEEGTFLEDIEEEQDDVDGYPQVGEVQDADADMDVQPQSEHEGEGEGEVTPDEGHEEPPEAEVLGVAAPPEDSAYKGLRDKPAPAARSGRRPAPPK